MEYNYLTFEQFETIATSQKMIYYTGTNNIDRDTVADSENSRSRWLFSKMGTKIFKNFFCRGFADIKPSDIIVRKKAL